MNMEQIKTRKYDRYLEHTRVRCLPFVCEAFGAMGQEAQQVLTAIAAEAHYVNTTAYDAFRSHAVTVMSVAIQRGNARMAMLAQRNTFWRADPEYQRYVYGNGPQALQPGEVIGIGV